MTAWERHREIIAFEPAAAIGAFAGSAPTADGYAMRVMNTQGAEALQIALREGFRGLIGRAPFVAGRESGSHHGPSGQPRPGRSDP